MKEFTHQHGGPKVKLVKELSNENVHLNQAFLVCLLHLPNDVSEPFILLLGARHPQEEHLQQKNHLY